MTTLATVKNITPYDSSLQLPATSKHLMHQRIIFTYLETNKYTLAVNPSKYIPEGGHRIFLLSPYLGDIMVTRKEPARYIEQMVYLKDVMLEMDEMSHPTFEEEKMIEYIVQSAMYQNTLKRIGGV